MIVVDTNAFIWLAHGDPMATPALTAIDAAVRSSVILVPSIVAWEIGLAVSKGRLKLAIDVQEWLARALVLPGVREVPLAADVALASTRLPGVFHADPADRLIIAQARALGAPLLTSDRAILAYAKAGHLKAIRAR
ncbi:MAG: type II toxin-antitoxin system VapC family toxin [Tagaea sp.]